MAQDDGKCGVHNYPNLNEGKITLIIDEMRRAGMTVTGDNPWSVDTKSHGVKLRGTWNSGTQTLSVIVTAKDWYVPCGKIWEKIDPLISHVREFRASDHEEVAAVAAVAAAAAQDDGKCGVHNYTNLSSDKINLILGEMRRAGMAVTGDNPWSVDTKSHGVKLRGTWNSGTQTLSVIVTAKDWYVPCGKIWEKIDPMIPHVREFQASDHEEVMALAAAAAQDDGKCGVHNYTNLSSDKINLMLGEMRRAGMAVTGDNPWSVDTKSHGVKLRGTWNSGTRTLSVIVTAKDWYVPCGKIWEKIDPMIPHVQELADHEVAAISQMLTAP